MWAVYTFACVSPNLGGLSYLFSSLVALRGHSLGLFPWAHLTFQGNHSFPSLHLFLELLIFELWSSGTPVLNFHLPSELDLLNDGMCWE